MTQHCKIGGGVVNGAARSACAGRHWGASWSNVLRVLFPGTACQRSFHFIFKNGSERRRKIGSIPSKSIIVTALLSLICAGRALAADVAVPPPASPTSVPFSYYPATAPFNWGGIYIGVNGGYAFGSSTWTNAGASTGSFATNGGLAGGTLGINYAGYGGFMFGVEGDLDWSALSGSSSVAACVGLGAPTGAACQSKSSWLMTARARFGYELDRILVFGTAGAAIGDLQVGLNPPGVFGSLQTQFGWTAGGGIEYAFTDNVTAKLEYLYVDFGTAACAAVNSCGVLSNASVSLTESLVRVGVNYKFSW